MNGCQDARYAQRKVLGEVAQERLLFDIQESEISSLRASGIMGTAAAIGGPPVDLVYQDRPGGELRSTLSLAFVIGLIMSLVGLAIAGKVQGWHALFALKLLPGLLLGLLVSNFAAPFLEKRWLRPTVLTLAAVSAVVVIAKGLVALVSSGGSRGSVLSKVAITPLS